MTLCSLGEDQAARHAAVPWCRRNGLLTPFGSTTVRTRRSAGHPGWRISALPTTTRPGRCVRHGIGPFDPDSLEWLRRIGFATTATMRATVAARKDTHDQRARQHRERGPGRVDDVATEDMALGDCWTDGLSPVRPDRFKPRARSVRGARSSRGAVSGGVGRRHAGVGKPRL
jgi:hypothetical protein